MKLVILLLAAAADGPFTFTEITESSGIAFRHDPLEEGKYLLPEITGSGAALVDYDGDGDLDIYLVQSGGRGNKLFRQDAKGAFTDVTSEAGVGDTGYGMGVAVGDFDNDGDVDFYVTNDGPDVLYRNLGNGRFEDATRELGITGDAWSASATFCDQDGDGFLDLYVTQYVSYDAQKACTHSDGSADYCSPQVFPAASDKLYRNEGGRRFTDISGPSGIRGMRAPGLGVLCADLNDDGRLDFYVANDGEANQLWLNEGGGRFFDEALLLGVALDPAGQPEAGMGITAGDVDADGDLDLFVTHVINQTNTLYINDGELGYEDRTTASGLAASSLAMTGFGTGFFDFNHDGELDLAIANGRVQRHPPLPGASLSAYWNVYAEPNQLLVNDGAIRFRDVTSAAGDFGAPVEVSRALVFGDIDEDGDLDLLVTNTASRVRLYRNDASKVGGWLLVRAFDPERKRDAHSAPRKPGLWLSLEQRPACSFRASRRGRDRAHRRHVARWKTRALPRRCREPRGRGGERGGSPGSVRHGQKAQEEQKDAAAGATGARTCHPGLARGGRGCGCGDAMASGNTRNPGPGNVSDGAASRGEDRRNTRACRRRHPLGGGLEHARSGLSGHELFPEAAASYAQARALDPEDYRWPYLEAQCLKEMRELGAAAPIRLRRASRSLYL